MKTTCLIPVLGILLVAAALAQMPQTITTYSSTSWPQTTTIWPQPGGGYNYTRIGNGGPAWGGVTAAPGTTVSAAVGSHGQIVPIVTPKAPEPSVIEMTAIDAPIYGLPSLPRLRSSIVKQPAKVPQKEIPPPAAYINNPYGQYAWLHNQLTRDSMTQLAIDWRKDSGSKKGDMHQTKALLAYLRLWVRSHPGCLSGKVVQPDTKSDTK